MDSAIRTDWRGEGPATSSPADLTSINVAGSLPVPDPSAVLQRRAGLPTGREIKEDVADLREFLQEGTFSERKALIRNLVTGIEIMEYGVVPA